MYIRIEKYILRWQNIRSHTSPRENLTDLESHPLTEARLWWGLSKRREARSPGPPEAHLWDSLVGSGRCNRFGGTAVQRRAEAGSTGTLMWPLCAAQDAYMTSVWCTETLIWPLCAAHDAYMTTVWYTETLKRPLCGTLRRLYGHCVLHRDAYVATYAKQIRSCGQVCCTYIVHTIWPQLLYLNIF